MKKEVSPVVVVVAILAVVAVAAFGWTRFTGVARKDGQAPPSMPPEVAKKWSQYTGAAPTGNTMPGAGQAGRPTGPQGTSGAPPVGIPTGPGGGAMAPGGVPTGPPGMGR
jgi:hypothetical protein